MSDIELAKEHEEAVKEELTKAWYNTKPKPAIKAGQKDDPKDGAEDEQKPVDKKPTAVPMGNVAQSQQERHMATKIRDLRTKPDTATALTYIDSFGERRGPTHTASFFSWPGCEPLHDDGIQGFFAMSTDAYMPHYLLAL
ncbi:hypothetical protein A1O3_07482 [Capronia epimyces CBS 606.96]|uniref:Uncharacterized protein n=1 Tax=Capronia epimyces CBS 606.96 TaxID=1182542 RepID=W9XKX9_9EURO|nr:uncharacterized protein A1O3_07482 [Capronia epimyces CBS 606.96]EXJ81192.1 hypothetical protein A1O3_07482 [Capronia epimyces CBS 606.96]